MNRDGGNGSGDDGENDRDNSAISLDTITLEMEARELIDRVTILEQGHSSVSSHCTKIDSLEAETDFV